MRKQLFRSSLLGFMALALSLTAFMASPKQALAGPFTCEPVFYQTQVLFGTTLFKLDPATNSYVSIAEIPLGINAIGYNTEDNFMYGYSGDDLVRIHSDGAVDNLGPPIGSVSAPPLGDFDRSGNHYMISGNNLIITDVDPVPTMTITPLTGTPIGVNDIVYIDGKLYGTNGANLMIVDIATAQITTRSLGLPTTIYGAGWASVDDSLYFGRNTDGAIFQVLDYTTANPSAVLAMWTNSTAVGNDGASCSLARSALEINAVDDTATTPAGQPITVSAEDGLLSNDTPETVSVTSYTQPSGGTVVVNPDGSYTYTPNPGFSGVDIFTYTITDSVGNTATASVRIAVTPVGSAVAGDSSQPTSLAKTGSNQLLYLLTLGVLVFGTTGYGVLKFSTQKQ